MRKVLRSPWTLGVLLLAAAGILLWNAWAGADPAREHHRKALKYVEQDRELAVLEWEEAVRADPGFAEARRLLADSLSALGRFDRAREEYRAWAGLRPGERHVYCELAAVELAAGRRDAARADAELELGRNAECARAREVLSAAGAPSR